MIASQVPPQRPAVSDTNVIKSVCPPATTRTPRSITPPSYVSSPTCLRAQRPAPRQREHQGLSAQAGYGPLCHTLPRRHLFSLFLAGVGATMKHRRCKALTNARVTGPGGVGWQWTQLWVLSELGIGRKLGEFPVSCTDWTRCRASLSVELCAKVAIKLLRKRQHQVLYTTHPRA
ncbi:hypothetical protein LZ30DRAFT_718074 [Colletotrichum cereale]|nr:hypothetical protein LZ30DRAFT_718074 [Colletotrichum cereale]